ncbi:hypothetical protein S40288_04436 [Stachybotrys chartarum IBT 40288]|nr:hypothetical protein S40288_04436 [Stachybotrys chartarum IBT 40288]
MPSQTTSSDHGESLDPSTPRKASTPAARQGKNAPSTPAQDATSPGAATPKSAPEAGGGRPRSNSKKPEPTLLTDFLMGRPSAQRLAADRQRRQGIEAVKAELRHEMRQDAVRRLQQPGGVGARVKAWQRNNAAAMVTGDPEDNATEPSDVAFKGEDFESVTEEDRIRIKMRQKKKPGPRDHPPVVIKMQRKTGESTEDSVGSKSPPKKRVVSDEHWVKSRARPVPTRKVSPKTRKASSPSGIPKDFVRRTANPTVSSKIKAWADKVEVPDTPPPRSHRSSGSRERSAHSRKSGSERTSETGDATSEATTRQPTRSKTYHDDGIRVEATGRKKLDDDGIRVRPIRSKPLPDDGIRVRPMSAASSDASHSRNESPHSGRQRGKTVATSKPRKSSANRPAQREERDDLSEQIEVILDSDEYDAIEVIEEIESLLETPTRRQGSKRRSTEKVRPKSHHPTSTVLSGESSWVSEGDSASGSGRKLQSDLTSSIAAKSLADIPGEIPFGHSAFSELDLPLNGAARTKSKRPKVDRNTSFKGMPTIFKKVVEEGKKIIHDINDPPKQPVANNPPSIEKWLNNTVDPFVDGEKMSTASKPKPAEKEQPEETKTRRKSSQEAKTPRRSSPKHRSADNEDQATTLTGTTGLTGTTESTDITESTQSTESTEAITELQPEPPKKEVKPPTAGGLKRSRATRSSSSPTKPSGRRPFFGIFKEAFQGESASPPKYPKTYQSQEARQYEETELGYAPPTEDSLVSSGTRSPPRSPPRSPTNSSPDSAVEATPRMAGPRLRPPTNGHYELSTILSEGDSSAVDSDMTSDLSRSTLTQSTVLTRDSDISRTEDQGPGLKRRLTRHSDLVSVLSLPDNSKIPDGIKSGRSRPSLRKTRGASDDVSADDLLREFIDDENLYLRELKTLVDGVIPVLLSHAVNGDNLTEIFGSGASDSRADALSKSVVGMGVALEKLKTAHKKAPVSDIRRLAHWAHGVVPIYSSYIASWRLGFQDLVVNLAPPAERDDEDSLLDALPRNAKGDIVNAEGERVDVAHLLKRPLLRLKQMVKFIKCVVSIVPSEDTAQLLNDFEDLQEKARRKHREEVARMTDEEATGTDTTRARELRTLGAAESVAIYPHRQVNAKDVFSLELEHSNGQRLECKVELVFRDNQARPEDEGDLLIREIGDGRRTYLLFEPFPMAMVSARTGDGELDMVVMIRGSYHGKQWHELLTLTTDNEDQILDWLDILPVSPVPPREPEPSVVGDLDLLPSQRRMVDVPVGVSRLDKEHARDNVEPLLPRSPTTPTKRSLPTRYHPRSPLTAAPCSPPPAVPLSPIEETTPKQADYHRPKTREGTSRPLTEDMRPDPQSLAKKTPNSTPFRDDGAPPPPIHRSLAPPPPLKPSPKSKNSDRIKRRTSSPLKHEYLPSDISSTSETSYTEEESDYESSEDEIESVDIPETELGVSIKESQVSTELDSDLGPPVNESECSLTPSNSASQAGLHGHKTAEDNVQRFVASVSKWSDKGMWKNVWEVPCSIMVKAGMIEAYAPRRTDAANEDERPLLGLDLTPLVLIRQSTALDLEIRSSIQPHCQLASSQQGGGNFRFRCHNGPECFNLYMAVHNARLNNQKFIQLENEARFKSFGERKPAPDNDDDTSSRRRSWFGRKNSYRSSVRAPSQSHDGASTTPSSSVSATSFLRRLTGAGNLSFNIARSSVDKHHRMGSAGNSLYTSGSSSQGGTSPRSPSVSIGNSSRHSAGMNTDNLRIRLHLLVGPAKWEDFGNCTLQIRQPPPGWHQALRADHGLEKRITVAKVPKKDSDQPVVVLDAVLGSGCFSPMGVRGIVCGVWEEAKVAGDVAPATGPTGGNIKKWCFQCASVADADWVLRLVHQEVLRA